MVKIIIQLNVQKKVIRQFIETQLKYAEEIDFHFRKLFYWINSDNKISVCHNKYIFVATSVAYL